MDFIVSKIDNALNFVSIQKPYCNCLSKYYIFHAQQLSKDAVLNLHKSFWLVHRFFYFLEQNNLAGFYRSSHQMYSIEHKILISFRFSPFHKDIFLYLSSPPVPINFDLKNKLKCAGLTIYNKLFRRNSINGLLQYLPDLQHISAAAVCFLPFLLGFQYTALFHISKQHPLGQFLTFLVSLKRWPSTTAAVLQSSLLEREAFPTSEQILPNSKTSQPLVLKTIRTLSCRCLYITDMTIYQTSKKLSFLW